MLASIAYMDPSNFATNIAAGARYAGDLLWVVVLANGIIAMLFQAHGRRSSRHGHRAQPRRVLYRDQFACATGGLGHVDRRGDRRQWRTDLAEFLGASLGLSLLLGLPLHREHGG